MPATSIATPRIETIEREIDQARQRGVLQQITVPPCPSLLTRLQQAMAGPEPDLAEVGRIAGADVAMAATLIRNANGALYAVGPPVASVGQAMNRLGLNQTAAIMTGFLARHAIPVHSPLLEGFWEQSARRALAMACVARRLPGVAEELAYGYGLFAHVGLPVLLQSVRGYAGTMAEAAARKDRPFVATENANHRTDHAVVGALTARAWRLAPPVVAAIRLHHDLDVIGSDSTEPEVHTLLSLGLVADELLARHLGRASDADWATHGSRALGWLQLDADNLDTASDALADALQAD